MIVRNKYPHIGDLEVLESAAGFYIGRLYYEAADDANPYDRVSYYYPDYETAKDALINNDWIDNFN